MVTISSSAAGGDCDQPPENILNPVASVSDIALT